MPLHPVMSLLSFVRDSYAFAMHLLALGVLAIECVAITVVLLPATDGPSS